jgi:Protein of unknown function (DUF2867)
MFKSFRFWCFVAAAISGLTALLHVFGGGPEFHQPALSSDLPMPWKVAFSTIWHEVTAMLLLNGVFLAFAGLAIRKNLLVLWLTFTLNAAFAVLFFSYGILRLGTPWVLPQWSIFVAISACLTLCILGRNKLLGVDEATAQPEHFAALPTASFADTYVIHGTEFKLAIDAAHGAFDRAPTWISNLLQLRNALVRPFGLIYQAPTENLERIGMFPILYDAPQKVVLGLNDKHLDFRVVVELLNFGHSVSLTTLVKPHNYFGRAYLAVIMPFHRIIAATTLAQAAKASTTT